MILDTESMTVLRLTEAEVDTLRELVELMSLKEKGPKLLSKAQEDLLDDLKYNL
jgi:hypothetical protein